MSLVPYCYVKGTNCKSFKLLTSDYGGVNDVSNYFIKFGSNLDEDCELNFVEM